LLIKTVQPFLTKQFRQKRKKCNNNLLDYSKSSDLYDADPDKNA